MYWLRRFLLACLVLLPMRATAETSLPGTVVDVDYWLYSYYTSGETPWWAEIYYRIDDGETLTATFTGDEADIPPVRLPGTGVYATFTRGEGPVWTYDNDVRTLRILGTRQ